MAQQKHDKLKKLITKNCSNLSRSYLVMQKQQASCSISNASANMTQIAPVAQVAA